MKRICVFLSILFTSLPLNGRAQSVDTSSNPDSLLIRARTQLHEATNVPDIRKLLESRASFERLLSISTRQWLVHYYIALADRYISQSYLAANQIEKVVEFVDDGVDHLDKCIDKNQDFAEAYALTSSLLGTKISVSPIQGMVLGPRSVIALSKAESLDPHNPRVLLMSGISVFHRPKAFGGGADRAMDILLNAAEHFSTYEPASELYPQWGHEEVYAWLGQIAESKEDYAMAKMYYKKALEINTNYSWVG